MISITSGCTLVQPEEVIVRLKLSSIIPKHSPLFALSHSASYLPASRFYNLQFPLSLLPIRHSLHASLTAPSSILTTGRFASSPLRIFPFRLRFVCLTDCTMCILPFFLVSEVQHIPVLFAQMLTSSSP